MKKTLVLGATTNPERYAYKAVHALIQKGHEVIPFGIKKGKVADIAIRNNWPENEVVDTITLYVGAARQPPYYAQILGLKPKRILFNPGTENPELYTLAKANGIEVEVACTLVLLNLGTY